jgi:Domain of unknown function (DUF4145)
MANKSNPPSVTSTAFECPHCAAYTTQKWYKLLCADPVSGQPRTPLFPDENSKKRIQSAGNLEPEQKAELIEWIENMQLGLVFIQHDEKGTVAYKNAENLHISQCFNCEKIAVWVYKSLVFPLERAGELPNADLPADIAHDFEEARSILNESPRGAAALLRLAVQKLCAFLGEDGKNIDADIASLVSKGLNPLVQKSLDVVRVVGNEAVHPGSLDLRDDRDTALQLLGLVNLIAEQMISHPKSVQLMYNKLPENKLQAIDSRNQRALGGQNK